MADAANCILDRNPVGTGAFAFKMCRGISAAAEYPADAKWQMSKRYPTRLKAPMVVDNTCNMLIVHRSVKDVLEGTGVAMECYPFTLLDHRGNVASAEHFIVNPLGSFDCLDLQRSRIQYSQQVLGQIVGIDRMVLDPKKLEQAPDLFRVKESVETYVVSHRLVELLRPANPSNLFLKKLDQAG
ncbi:MAG: hypothetical protein QM767_18520 [Anaeromyxobacter sp.]